MSSQGSESLNPDLTSSQGAYGASGSVRSERGVKAP